MMSPADALRAGQTARRRQPFGAEASGSGLGEMQKPCDRTT